MPDPRIPPQEHLPSDQAFPPKVVGEYELVPNDPNDGVEIIKGTLTRGQDALHSILDAAPGLLKGFGRGKIAKFFAEAQKTLSEAQVSIEELSVKKQVEANRHREKMLELKLSEDEAATRTKQRRAALLAKGFKEVAEGAEKLKAAGLDTIVIQQIVMEQIEAMKDSLEEGGG